MQLIYSDNHFTIANGISNYIGVPSNYSDVKLKTAHIIYNYTGGFSINSD